MSNPSILIVEDEAIVAEDLANKVREMGYDVLAITATGEEAVELARQLRPSLVLMDIQLAGPMDGVAAAKIIQRECKLPVLFLTAHSDTGTVDLAKKVGASGYILKPFGERELRIQIEMGLFKHIAERQIGESQERLTGINQILHAALTCKTEEQLGETCLNVARNITQSGFGCIGEITKGQFAAIAISPSSGESYQSDSGVPPVACNDSELFNRFILEGRSLFVNDPANHPDSYRQPENLPPLTSFLGVPLGHTSSVCGLLMVGNREGGYSRTEQDALETLAPSIVQAFSHKRAEVELQNSSAELQAANIRLFDSRRATINIMQDAIRARQQVEATNAELQREVVERKQAEEALLTLNLELEKRVERRTVELQETQKQFLHVEKLSAIGQLSASIAHEFNNPLQGILIVLKGLKKRLLMEKEDRELLEQAIGEGDRIRDLIRSLQDFNRPSSFRKSLVDVHKSLDSILLLNRSDFKGKRILVVLDYADYLPQIAAVPDQIKQVFLNILTNAADACRQGGGVITVSTRLEDEEKVAVVIKDTGVGIQPSNLEQIFQPFYTTKPEVKGTGLGLSISYGIVKSHGGDIHVASQPGEGSTFTVLLPIKGADELS